VDDPYKSLLVGMREENEALRTQLTVVCSQAMHRQETPLFVLVLACGLLFFALVLALFA